MTVFLLKGFRQPTHLLEHTQIRNQQINVFTARRLLDFGLRCLAFRAIAAHQNNGRATARQFSGRDFPHASGTACHQANLSLQTVISHVSSLSF
jgi:hypothetical protein